MNVEDFKRSMTPIEGVRFEYPSIEDVKSMSEDDRSQGVDFLRKMIRNSYGISKEQVSILFCLDPASAISIIDETSLRASHSWAALTQYYHEKSKIGGSTSSYLDLAKEYSFMDKDGRNQFWYLLPHADLSEEKISELELLVLGEAEKLPKVQGIQALLKAKGIGFGTSEYKKQYQRLSSNLN